MARLLLSFAIAAVVYEFYWHLVNRSKGVHSNWIGRSNAEQRLRLGRAGFLRLTIIWALLLIIYAYGSESLLQPFTAQWWHGAVDSGEWIFIGVLAPFLAAMESLFVRSLLSSPHRRGSVCQSAPAPIIGAATPNEAH